MPNLDVDRLIAGWRGPLIAAFVAFLAGLPGLIAMPPLDRDESRFAQATAQMLESDDYIRIQFQDEPRNKKPVGIHWLQAAAVSSLSSEDARQIWAYRVPSLLGAMLAAAACAWGAMAFFGARGGLIAGLVLGCSMMLSTEAFIAKTDAVLCGCVTLAMAALSRLYADARAGAPLRRRHKLIFWIALGVSMLVKGPIGPMVAGLCLLLLRLWDGKSPWMRRIGWVWGLLLVVLIVGPWAMAITVATNGEFWSKAVGGDFGQKLIGGQESHGAPPGYYLLLLPMLLYPATVLLPAALGAGWTRRFAPGVRFAVCWLLPSWIVFELVPTKLPHYTLPLYGALAWLVAAALQPPPQISAAPEPPVMRNAGGIGRLTRLVAHIAFGVAGYVTAWLAQRIPAKYWMALRIPAKYWPGIGRWLGLVLSLLATALIAAAAILGLRLYGDPGDVVWTSLTVGFAAIGFFIVAFFVINRLRVAALLTACVFGVLAHTALVMGLAPNLKPLWVSRNIARELDRKGLDPRNGLVPGPVATLGYSEPSLIFLLGTETEILDPEDAAAAAAQGRPILVEQKMEPRFRAELARQQVSVQPIATINGVNYSRGRRVSITLYRQRGAPNPPAGPQS
jgi:4-amino-4-deoxy-L-arabinose transferase-like glycosyltransferase